jgi:hypothetical protein
MTGSVETKRDLICVKKRPIIYQNEIYYVLHAVAIPAPGIWREDPRAPLHNGGAPACRRQNIIIRKLVSECVLERPSTRNKSGESWHSTVISRECVLEREIWY